MRLTNALDWLSSGDESEQEESEWLNVTILARQCCQLAIKT